MEASEIADCYPVTAMETFKLVMIQGTKFHTSLVKYSFPDMQTLNTRAQIYIRLEENVENKIKFAAPQLIRQPLEQRDKTKHYAYHKDYGHITNDCRSLRLQVENMILRGELANYLTTNEYVTPQEVNPRKVEAHKLRRLSSVHTIALGRVNIWFGNGDLSRVQLPYEDPFVIGLLVANCMIKRVLIDPGSRANIITKAVFEQLEIPSSLIRPTSSPLMGFDSIKVDPLGLIDLFVTAVKRTLKENFVLTEIYPSYNLIMGRGWIHRMNGVPSTFHQVMQCLSPEGKEVIDLRGDQVAAKECYILIQNEANKQLRNPLPRYLKVEDEAEAEKPTKESLEAVEAILGNP
ncbi:uncharacterized protein LOC132272833 [Cornus florida]|uniref:uncharacterized protein LOC132272833 n=1 Tax=Cornus florida TaxID=4283 RepID=UPI00289B9C09|nr:uncharacterized protein LOC132272833 [Cornus florida]